MFLEVGHVSGWVNRKPKGSHPGVPEKSMKHTPMDHPRSPVDLEDQGVESPLVRDGDVVLRRKKPKPAACPGHFLIAVWVWVKIKPPGNRG